LQEQPTHRLQLLLLAGRLIRVLRQLKASAATLGVRSPQEVRNG
jgi:hypothetical protein